MGIIHSVLFLAITTMFGLCHSQDPHQGHTHSSGNYGYGQSYGGYQKPKYGMYKPPSYGGYQTYGYGSYKPPTYGNYGGYQMQDTETTDAQTFDPDTYVTSYMDKLKGYNNLQNKYKTDTVNVKVNWDLQDQRYGYLQSEHGIYPQVHHPIRPYGYGGYSGYGGQYGGYHR